MRELSVLDMQVVSGGITEAEAAALGGALGGGIALGVGQALGLSATDTLVVIGLGSAAGAALTTSGIIGFAIGSGLNQYTPIQQWISNVLDSLNGQDSDG